MVDAVRAAGGEVYAVTSEPQALATRARQDWDLPFECIGDPHHEIADAVRECGWLDLHVQEAGDFLTRDTAWDVTHPKGHFQPGVLVLNSNGHLLYRWRSVPSRKNAGGAAGRPTAAYVWGQVRHALARQSGEDAALDEAPMLDGRPVIFPLFAALLMANGWFMRPRPFTYQGDWQESHAAHPDGDAPLVPVCLAVGPVRSRSCPPVGFRLRCCCICRLRFVAFAGCTPVSRPRRRSTDGTIATLEDGNVIKPPR